MRPSSAKQKGRKLQQWVRDKLLEYAPSLLPDDVRSTSMGAGGEDVQLSPAARAVYPYAIECKAQESLNVWAGLDQAQEHAGDYTALLVFKRNHSKTYVALEFEEFLKLTRK